MRRGDVKDWVIFQDEHLLVMNKPAGLFTTPGRFEKHCLLGVARALRAEAEVVHRLDLDTSGLVVFGCSKPAISGLNRLFRERRIEKQYVALVAGTSSAESGEIAFPLGPDRLRRPRQRVNWRHGKAALTRYRVLETALAHSRLALTPVTGVPASTAAAFGVDWVPHHRLRFVCAYRGSPGRGPAHVACPAVDLRAPGHESTVCFPSPGGLLAQRGRSRARPAVLICG